MIIYWGFIIFIVNVFIVHYKFYLFIIYSFSVYESEIIIYYHYLFIIDRIISSICCSLIAEYILYFLGSQTIGHCLTKISLTKMEVKNRVRLITSISMRLIFYGNICLLWLSKQQSLVGVAWYKPDHLPFCFSLLSSVST